MIINAENLILGRLACFGAKQALLGNDVIVINCEKAIVAGTKKYVISHYKHKVERGSPRKGPFFPRKPEMLVKRTIRGMLPFKKDRGKCAFKKIKCYVGIPKEFEGKEYAVIHGADASKLPTLNYGTVNTICKELGGVK